MPWASYPFFFSYETVSSICFLSLLEIITLTPCFARSSAIPFPMPVDDAVIIATLPCISQSILYQKINFINLEMPINKKKNNVGKFTVVRAC